MSPYVRYFLPLLFLGYLHDVLSQTKTYQILSAFANLTVHVIEFSAPFQSSQKGWCQTRLSWHCGTEFGNRTKVASQIPPHNTTVNVFGTSSPLNFGKVNLVATACDALWEETWGSWKMQMRTTL